MPGRRTPLTVLSLLFLLAAAPAQTFVDRTDELGIVHEHNPGFDRIGEHPWLHDWSQSGIALGDLDGDDDLDVVACGGPLPLHVLRNDGATFTDVTDASGVASGGIARVPALGDVDNDGDLDLFLGTVERGEGDVGGDSRLFVNDGTGVFTDVSEVAGTFGAGHTIHAKFADLDNDGLLDLWTGEFHGTPNHWYRNNGDLSFTEMGALMELDVGGSTHVLAVADTDGDGWLDGFVGNDFSATRMADLVINSGDAMIQGQPDGTMIDVSGGSGYDVETGIMGLTVADVDYDGLLDVYKTDAGPNDLVLNQGWPGSGTPWLDQTGAFGVLVDAVPDPQNPGEDGVAISWGCAFFHADLDPWLDLYVANGMVAGPFETENQHTRFQQDYFFVGQGPSQAFAFADETQNYGLLRQVDARGIAVGDVDGDGDLDLFVSATAGPLCYFENQLDRAGQGWLKVVPDPLTSNRDGAGTLVSWTDALGLPHLRQIGSDGPTASQNPNVAHFGLGTEASVDVTVAFRSGITRTIAGVAPDTVLTVTEPELVRLSTRTLPIASQAGPGDPTEVVVTAFAHDASGTPLDATADVTIEADGLVATTPVTNVGGNEFSRTFAAPQAAGSHRVEVAFDGFAPRISPRVHAYGSPTIGASTVRVRPEAVRAGSDDTFTVRIAPKDAAGVSVGSGLPLVLEPLAGEPSLTGTIDLGNGLYEATYAAPRAPGLYPIDLTMGPTSLPAVATIEVGGAPEGVDPNGVGTPGGPVQQTASDVYIEDPNPVNSATPHQFKVLVTPRDLAGRRLGPRTRVAVEVAADAGTAPVALRRLAPLDGGEFPLILEKEPPPFADPATGTLTIRADGRLVATVPYDF